MLEFRIHYRKALKVVNSCTEPVHLIAAERYVHLLARNYSTSVDGVVDFENPLVVREVNYLLKKIKEKKYDFSC